MRVNVFEIQSDGDHRTEPISMDYKRFQLCDEPSTRGLEFWSNQAANYGSSVTFSIGVWEPYNSMCNHEYEPVINYYHGEDWRWINEVMKKFVPRFLGARLGGYSTAPPVDWSNVENSVEQFNYDQRHVSGYPTYDGISSAGVEILSLSVGRRIEVPKALAFVKRRLLGIDWEAAAYFIAARLNANPQKRQLR